MKSVFVDGSAGTTGLQIRERLSRRTDLTCIELPDELRKDPDARREAMRKADFTFLCLPDEEARKAVVLAEDTDTLLIDTSTTHRTADGWTYGFPELTGMREKIARAKRIANPGCHASGFIALVAPLVEQGLLDRDVRLTCISLTGYSGGGKKTIAAYQSKERDALLDAPRMYALTQGHKHLPEMVRMTKLTNAPVFCPVIADFYSGMEITVPLFASDLHGTVSDIRALYAERYNGKIVHYTESGDENGFLSAGAFSGRDDMQITVCGNDERILLIARYDNLGKGASGAAVQNLNCVLNVEETTGLNL